MGFVLSPSFSFQSHGFGVFGLGLCYMDFDFFVVVWVLISLFIGF